MHDRSCAFHGLLSDRTRERLHGRRHDHDTSPTVLDMSNAGVPAALPAGIRVGDLLPRHLMASGRARRIDAVAFVAPGRGELADYARELEAHAAEFADWDGRIAWLAPDRDPMHRVVIADRYGQVYDVTTASDSDGLPTSDVLEEWFRFLATACPECGVIDDPLPREWTP